MTEETPYLKRDLEDLADLDKIEDPKGTYGKPSRKEILQKSLSLAEDRIESVSKGSYQGYILFIFRKEGNLWLLKDSYGSCSGCDGLLASEHAKYYAKKMMRNAYAFRTDNDAIRFLHLKQEDGSYGWKDLVDGGISAVNELPGGFCDIHETQYVYYDNTETWGCPFCNS